MTKMGVTDTPALFTTKLSSMTLNWYGIIIKKRLTMRTNGRWWISGF